MQLKTESGRPAAIMNFDQVRDALSKLDENGNSFAILEDNERFIQTAIEGSAMIVEKNEGSRVQHFRASRSGSEQFGLSEVEAIFRSWYDRAPMPVGVQWSKIEVHGISRPLWWLLWVLPWIAVAYVAYDFLRGTYSLWDFFR